MLYDPKWERKTETKADPLTLEAFVAWLEKQPADKPYCYSDAGHCLAAQYNQSIGRDYRSHQPTVTMDTLNAPRDVTSFDMQMELVAVSAMFLCGKNNQWDGMTFGTALQRACEYQRVLAD